MLGVKVTAAFFTFKELLSSVEVYSKSVSLNFPVILVF